MDTFATFSVLDSQNWQDYELLDTGDGLKLERFGPYTFIRPEVQAMWKQALPDHEWEKAHATFQPTSEESGGHWVFKKKVDERWKMSYDLAPASFTKITPEAGYKKEHQIRFWAMTTPGRHLGVFPETAPHWDFITQVLQKNPARPDQVQSSPVKVLNLFGYTGLASLTAAASGAQVTHVDASKKSISWARENQALSKLEDKPIRWIVDDALKFTEREGRRGAKYDGLILDPPKFGRGPKGEVWEVYKSLPGLLEACRAILSDRPLFVIVTAYAIKTSAFHIGQALQSVTGGFKGIMEGGELVIRESSAGRLLSQAAYARWRSE
jgi:23S rRNA (cytosine1962-C5)-methyltransferase